MGQCQDKLSPKTIKDLHESTNFTDEQIKDWYKKFKAEHPDGKITLDELKKNYAEIFPHGDSNAFAEEVFRVFDANKDGSLNFKEFVLAIYVTRSGSVEDRVAASFKLFDEDGKGTITEDETRNVFKGYYNMIAAFGLMTIDSTPEKETENFFEALDKNNDKQITKEEFVAKAKDMPMILNVLNFHVKVTEEIDAEKSEAASKSTEKENKDEDK